MLQTRVKKPIEMDMCEEINQNTSRKSYRLDIPIELNEIN